MKRTTALLATVLTATLAGPLAVAAAPAAQAAPYCGITWGSLAKTAAPMTQAKLVGVRAGQHACFDRLVLDVAGGDVSGYDVSYVPQIVTEGQGAVIATRGGAALQVVARVPAYDGGQETYAPPNRNELAPVASYRTFRQVVWAGSYEGQSTVGIGVRARLPFRVFVLDGPGNGSRLVVDVAHLW